jgi:predicted protein tyrosine phosphatase
VTIVVCPLSRVHEMVAKYTPERVVSVLDPHFTFPDLGAAYRDRHLKLCFHDVHVPADGDVVASVEHARALVAFLREWQRERALLVHCRAGVGRSTATAFIAACALNPRADEYAIARRLRRASTNARPNENWVGVADRVLKRRGRMRRAIEDTGRGLPWIDVAENEPFELASDFDATGP